MKKKRTKFKWNDENYRNLLVILNAPGITNKVRRALLVEKLGFTRQEAKDLVFDKASGY